MKNPFEILRKVGAKAPTRAYWLGKVSEDLPETNDPIVLPHDCFWVEANTTGQSFGVLYKHVSEIDVRIAFFDKRGRRRFTFNLYDAATKPEPSEMELLGLTFVVLLNVRLKRLAVHHENEHLPDRPEIWERKGDTMQFVRLTDQQVREHAQAHLDAIIRKREHDVRGHWRTLRSGQQTWVRGHKRGDPELGRVTTHMAVE